MGDALLDSAFIEGTTLASLFDERADDIALHTYLVPEQARFDRLSVAMDIDSRISGTGQRGSFPEFSDETLRGAT